MAEPKMFTILQRIQSDLQAILADGGTTYFYTPDLVLIVRTRIDQRLWDSSIGGSQGIIYAIWRTERNHQEDTTGDSVSGGNLEAAVNVHILVSQRFTPSSPSDTPEEAQVVERMLRDVLRAIFMDPQLGGLVNNAALEGSGADDAVIDDAPEGWAAAELVFRVTYSYPASAP